MVAFADYHRIAFDRMPCGARLFNRAHAVYLYPVLGYTVRRMNNASYTAIIGLMTGFIILSFIFQAHQFIWLAAGLGLIALVFPSYAHRIACAWRAIMRGIGFCMLYSVLIFLFFIVLTPLAILYRFCARTAPLQHNKKTSGSYYVSRNHFFSASDFEKLW